MSPRSPWLLGPLLFGLAGCQLQISTPPAVRAALFTLDRPPNAPSSTPPVGVVGRPGAGTLPAPGGSAAAPTPAPAGGGGSSQSLPIEGRVLGLDGDQSVPISGARVQGSNGRVAVTREDGTFSLAGPLPPDGALVASAPGYVASAIVGLDGDAPLTLHLQPQAAPAETPKNGDDRSFKVRGRVADSAGTPLPGALVVLADARGAYSVPDESDDNGHFELTVFAPGLKVVDGTLIAVGTDGVHWAGVATDVDASPEFHFLDFDATEAGLSPFRLTAADRPLTVTIDGSAIEAPASTFVELVGPGGTRLSVHGLPDDMRLANLSNAHYALRVEASDADRGIHSSLYQAIAPGATAVVETLLAPPTVTVSGDRLAWGDIPDATGYHATLTEPTSGLPVWEGFTTGTALTMATPGVPTTAGHTLTLSAWRSEGLAPRTIAALPARALRLMPQTGAYKQASRRITL